MFYVPQIELPVFVAYNYTYVVRSANILFT